MSDVSWSALLFLATREEYEPHYVDDRKYFDLSNFFDEFSKPRDQRRLPMSYEPNDAAIDVYCLWQDRNGGDRHAAVTHQPDESH